MDEHGSDRAEKPWSRQQKLVVLAFLVLFVAVGWDIYQDRKLDQQERKRGTTMYVTLELAHALDSSFDVDCADFAFGGNGAQMVLDAGRSLRGSARGDPFSLDPNLNGRACEMGTTFSRPMVEGMPIMPVWEDVAEAKATGGYRAWIQKDRDCQDFSIPGGADALSRVLGWPGYDPWLMDEDGDGDGKMCEPYNEDDIE